MEEKFLMFLCFFEETRISISMCRVELYLLTSLKRYAVLNESNFLAFNMTTLRKEPCPIKKDGITHCFNIDCSLKVRCHWTFTKEKKYIPTIWNMGLISIVKAYLLLINVWFKHILSWYYKENAYCYNKVGSTKAINSSNETHSFDVSSSWINHACLPRTFSRLQSVMWNISVRHFLVEFYSITTYWLNQRIHPRKGKQILMGSIDAHTPSQ